ncbi:MAG: hypothetical protein KDA78_21025, partial [Planctomycetaceae bacterium]|nr:hypothetical protein [Planctomycetaceae bacterium]
QKTGWSAAVCTIVSLMLGNATAQAFDETPPPVPANVSPSGEGRTSISDVQPYPYSYSQQPMYSIGAPEPDYFAMNGGSSEPMFRERGLGYYFRAGHQGGKGIGTEESLTYLEAMPYAFWEETMFLADGRVWALNSGRMGGSIGAGLRRYFPQIDRTIGMMAWYDIDATHLEDFQEMVVTLESHGNRLDWDANIYMPFDVRKQDIGLDFNDGSQRFVGNNILFDQTRTSAFALTGFDTMWSTPIGLEFAQPLDMRIGAGFYHFVHGDINDIWGWKGELEANVLRYLDLSLAVSDDATFDTRVTVNASWTFDPNREVGERDRTWDRMVLPPSRLWTVPKAEVAVVEPDQVAINPTTGMPYFVVHVDSITGVNAPGAGTVEMPFNTIENAINGVNMVPIDTYDTVFVHAGSVFDGQPTIVVPEGKRFLGEGDRIGHLFSYNQFGELRGPRARNDY